MDAKAPACLCPQPSFTKPLHLHPSIPISALKCADTADANPSTMKKAREAGFDGFLGKPIDPDRFPDQIAAILQGKPVWDLNEQGG